MAETRKTRKQIPIIRILMVGDSSVGKTSLVMRFDDKGFLNKYATTIGVDYSDRLVELEGEEYKLQVWDTAGQERFRALTSSFFKRADGFCLCYDISSRHSFDNVNRWMKDICEQARIGFNLILVGNKCDIPDSRREVSYQDGLDLANEFGVPFMEASAKTDRNVDEVFMTVAAAEKAGKKAATKKVGKIH
eukprot:CAMPEP_0117740744 /NCGR_PEP_ID=MMETSP0947-20121206/4518_1 /TAXON_ID=44440 /ORGANISM="Chattonella subsalsa, Strain CCMP2191" /LENGTH=190 /DNA_ID=CAMNT_0005556905 /DNA_START=145 /DNA_END=718 /DNA_ORIENTATION=+